MFRNKSVLKQYLVEQRRVIVAMQALTKARDNLLQARSDAAGKTSEAEFANDRAAAALQQVTRLQSDLDSARNSLSQAQDKLLATHQALNDSHAEKASLRARTAAAEGDVEGT
jgi:uncharacterized protein YaaN involved in tellurite resistance